MKPTILILAAGFATRYGSLKQIDHFGPSGESLIDYTVYDAIRAGFNKAVFVIRDSIADEFRHAITDKFSDCIEVTFASQELNKLPDGFVTPPEREKPWGTGHAVLMARSEITTPFLAVNADDFYGRSTFETMYLHLSRPDSESNRDCYSMGFRLANTLSEYGQVSRAVCEVDKHNYLVSMTELTGIVCDNGRIRSPEHSADLPGDTIVSMNVFGFTPVVFEYLEQYFVSFLRQRIGEQTAEFYLPAGVSKAIADDLISVKVLPTDAQWFGVTYKQDKMPATQKIAELVRNGCYPENLWR